jgi:hypothetical protein
MKKDVPRIHLLELSMNGVFHAGVNAGLTEVFGRVFPGAELVFRGGRNHLAALRDRLPEGLSVRTKPWPFFPRVSLRTLPLRDGLGCFYAAAVLWRSAPGDALVFTGLLPLTHRVVSALNRWHRREVFICLHGQLEALLPGSSLRGTKYYFGLHRALLKSDRRSRYLILGEPVWREIALLFSPASRTIVIDHPYDYGSEILAAPRYTLPLRFGQIGTGNRGKGTQRLFELAELLRGEIEAGQVEIHLAGRLDPALKKLDNGLVRYDDRPLPAEAFGRLVAGLHYALFLRGEGEGRGVPSGSFFDAVKAGKPYLSLDHAFVRHYHARVPESGEMCASLPEMAAAIRRIAAEAEAEAERGGETCHQRIAALAALRETLSTERIAVSFRKQLER